MAKIKFQKITDILKLYSHDFAENANKEIPIAYCDIFDYSQVLLCTIFASLFFLGFYFSI